MKLYTFQVGIFFRVHSLVPVLQTPLLLILIVVNVNCSFGNWFSSFTLTYVNCFFFFGRGIARGKKRVSHILTQQNLFLHYDLLPSPMHLLTNLATYRSANTYLCLTFPKYMPQHVSYLKLCVLACLSSFSFHFIVVDLYAVFFFCFPLVYLEINSKILIVHFYSFVLIAFKLRVVYCSLVVCKWYLYVLKYVSRTYKICHSTM